MSRALFFASRVFVVVTAALSSGCIFAGAIPPGRADLGPAFFVAKDKELVSARFSIGGALSSAFKRRTPYDVGLGYILRTGGDQKLPPDVENQNPPPTVHHGGYLEGSYGFQLGSEEWSRIYVGARGELFHNQGWGVTGRLAWESTMYVEGAGGSSNNSGAGGGIWAGRVGYGFFLEAGNQSLPEPDGRLNAFVVSTGMTMRFPAAFFLGIAFK